jgi:tetratricopeptide (TPR) repeat protein
VPRRLRAAYPDLPARLQPVFRDRDELAAGHDLSESIRHALADSEALVVLCSPSAHQSRWINAEIRQFRELCPRGAVLAVFCDGHPDPSHPDTGFPQALLEDAAGHALPEPLAADVRDYADGKRGALLKIVAGLLGVGVDELRQRDQQRRVRVLGSITAGALAIAAITVVLAINAITARHEAEVRRAQAENLIEFMLVELRDQLEPIGKLSLLDAVGDHAMGYFSALGEMGSEAEVLSRAMALRQIGEVRFQQGRLEPALHAFSESRDATAALHRATPEDSEILYQLGQAEFWVGYVAWSRNDLPTARSAMEAYQQAARQLAQREPAHRDYAMEASYAASNLGSIAREQGDTDAALAYFADSVRIVERLIATVEGDGTDLRYELGEALSWLGSVHLDRGELPESEAAFERAMSTLRALHRQTGLPLHEQALGEKSQLFADVLVHRGRLADARAVLSEGRQACLALTRRDADNAFWRRCVYGNGALLAELSLLAGDREAAEPLIQESLEGFGHLLAEDSTDARLQLQLARVEITAARAGFQRTRPEPALALGLQAYQRARQSLPPENPPANALYWAASVGERYGRLQDQAGAPGAARLTWEEALALLGEGPTMVQQRAVRALLLHHLGRDDEAAAIEGRLSQLGFSDPRYLPVGEGVISATGR